MDWGQLATAINGAIFGTSNIIQSQVNANRANRQQILNLQTQAMLNEMSANAADTRTRMLWQDLQSPEAMVRQYKEAGLNPGLMYGQSGASGSLIAGAQSHGVGMPQAIMAENVPILNQQAALMAAEINKTMAEVENLKVEKSLKEKDLPLKDQMLENMKTEQQKTRQEITESMEKTNLLFAQKVNEYQKNQNLKAEKEYTEAKQKYEQAMTALTNMQLEWYPKEIVTKIKEMNAKAAEAYAAAKKLNAEAETENQTRKYIVKQLQYAAEEQAYKTLHLQPAEYKLLQEQIQQVINQNGSMEGIRDAFGGWQNKAKIDKAMEIVNTVANGIKAIASTAGAAAIIAK